MVTEFPVETIAKLLQTLSEPNRLRIIGVLTLECQSVSAIVEATGLSQPLVSHHLRVMRRQGLVKGARRGSSIDY